MRFFFLFAVVNRKVLQTPAICKCYALFSLCSVRQMARINSHGFRGHVYYTSLSQTRGNKPKRIR